jgi:hypothetical protein
MLEFILNHSVSLITKGEKQKMRGARSYTRSLPYQFLILKVTPGKKAYWPKITLSLYSVATICGEKN